ncbi:hypothetical protein WKK05_36345 (plasmid) [Nostoc sp. UHCC 0302]|uniref:hypothetical protein n=1 Tax=Nostoc sp. UHCC 0302 TaxID=3134896 RepID=UPI00311CAF2F
MGLTIHYHFDAGSRPLTEIRHLIEELHSTAADLPFEFLDKEIVELVGEECHLTGSGEDKWSLLKIRAMKFDISNLEREEYPVHIIGFTSLPRRGAEELDIFLCRYKDSNDWVAHANCKTQYAQLPEHGGTPNFILAHTMIVALLDKAQSLGILEEVVDETDYWENRNPRALAKEGEDWNSITREIGEILKGLPKQFLSGFN